MTEQEREIAGIPRLQFWLTFFAILFAYELVAYVNSYVVDLKGAGMDAEKFQYLAAQWAQDPQWGFEISVGFYVELIGSIFLVFGRNEFIATQVSVIALCIAAWKLHVFLEQQGMKKHSLLVAAILLWPSLIPRGGTTLREPLILAGAVYLVTELTTYFQTNRGMNMVKAGIAGMALFFFHKATGLMALGILWAAGAYFLIGTKGRVRTKIAFFAGTGFVILVMLVLVHQFANLKDMQVLVTVLQGDVDGISAVLDYKYGVDARAAYTAPILFTDPFSFLFSIARAWFYYTFEPFPTRLVGIFDLYAFLEVCVRSAMMGYIIWHWRKLDRSYRFAFWTYLMISVVWSVGTTNYGTASRHHLTNYWILILLTVLIWQRLPRAIRSAPPPRPVPRSLPLPATAS